MLKVNFDGDLGRGSGFKRDRRDCRRICQTQREEDEQAVRHVVQEKQAGLGTRSVLERRKSDSREC